MIGLTIEHYTVIPCDNKHTDLTKLHSPESTDNILLKSDVIRFQIFRAHQSIFKRTYVSFSRYFKADQANILVRCIRNHRPMVPIDGPVDLLSRSNKRLVEIQSGSKSFPRARAPSIPVVCLRESPTFRAVNGSARPTEADPVAVHVDFGPLIHIRRVLAPHVRGHYPAKQQYSMYASLRRWHVR